MAFHHVLVSFRHAPNDVRCVLADLSEKDLKARFLRPYRKGQQFMSGNEIVETSTINKVKVIRTEETSERELAKIQVRSHRENDELNRGSHSVVFLDSGRGYVLEDIAEAGVDVTPAYVVRPPGVRGWLAEWFEHPWVTTVLAGVVVAGIIYWLGWT